MRAKVTRAFSVGRHSPFPLPVEPAGKSALHRAGALPYRKHHLNEEGSVNRILALKELNESILLLNHPEGIPQSFSEPQNFADPPNGADPMKNLHKDALNALPEGKLEDRARRCPCAYFPEQR